MNTFKSVYLAAWLGGAAFKNQVHKFKDSQTGIFTTTQAWNKKSNNVNLRIATKIQCISDH